MIFLSLFLAALATAAPIRQKGGPARTVMVQLFEWPWNSVAEECETVLGPGGFAAVQVSPPTEHLSFGNHPWWERYQPVSYSLLSRSGNEEEFASMVKRCRDAGVDIYADVVLNHMTGRAEGEGYAGTRFTHYQYGNLYGPEDFHHCGRNGNDDIVNFQDLYELQNCELLNLADLDTASPKVQEDLTGLLRHLLELGVAGFRVDAAKHIPAADIASIFHRVAAPFYAVHELIVSAGEPVNVDDYLKSGDVNVFPYAYAVGAAFLGGDLSPLQDLPGRLGIRSENAVVFLENHDLERRPPEETLVPFVKQPQLNRLATVFLLTFPYGYPQLYSGFSFEGYDEGPPLEGGQVSPPLLGGKCRAPWTCVHRDPDVLALVQFRNRTDEIFRATDLSVPRSGWISYGRGRLGQVIINASRTAGEVTVKTKLGAGRHCGILGGGGCPISGVVDHRGNLRVKLPPLSAFVAE